MVTKTATLTLLCGIMLAGGESANVAAIAAPSPDAPQEGIEVVVSMPAVIFKGLPCIAEVTVTNHTQKPPNVPLEALMAMTEADRKKLLEQEQAFNLRLPAYGLLDKQPPPFSVLVTDPSGACRLSPVEPGVLAFYYVDWRRYEGPLHGPRPDDFRRPTLPVGGGATAKVVFDLMPSVDALPVGTYEVVISVFPDWKEKGFDSRKVSFEVRTVDKGVGRIIQAAVPTIENDELKRPSGFDWFESEADCAAMLSLLPHDVYQQLAMVCLVKAARKFDGKSDIPEELVSSLPLFLQGKADAMVYEIVRASEDKTISQSLRARIMEKRPDLGELLDRIDRGVGLLMPDVRNDTESVHTVPESKEGKQ